MYKLESGSHPPQSDLVRFVEQLNAHSELTESEASSFFDPRRPVILTRAPGRLDVMGGIADYSGALVLQMPISEATFAAIQLQDLRRVDLLSLQGDDREPLRFEMPLDISQSGRDSAGYAEAKKLFESNPNDRWAAYAAGAFFVLKAELGIDFPAGARILIGSSVPQGKGVSSSAALEAAVMQAAAAAYDLKIEPEQLAILCQKVENSIAGAACGLMDQMTSVCGKNGSLLALLCQPADLQNPVTVPEGIEFFGLDSGVAHTVSGSDYTCVRVGAFMGHRIIADLAGLSTLPGTRKGLVALDDGAPVRYLADISPSEFESKFASRLPDRISGADFLSRYQGTVDEVTYVDPERIYAVRSPTAHPIYEHFRTRVFRELLARPVSEETKSLLGEMMFQSHASYSACGLGSEGTDLLIELIREAGLSKGVYGGRISGGGGGGTVAVLGRPGISETIKDIADAYRQRTGHSPQVFRGSSDGAATFGYIVLAPGD